ncbi:uncharacterized protein C5orf47 homolog isoform X1 [Castor canadensis]|uniref:Uncharacterized protein C5orf47 homolog isoform X1 n=1 Tax=Castor canadensis TaxID=51338 RepID=A0A8B7W6F7_CASCN
MASAGRRQGRGRGRGRPQEPDQARFVYVARFGSHQCGSVLQLGGRRDRGEPLAAASVRGGGLRVPLDPASSPSASGPEARTKPVRRAGIIQKDEAKMFDFPIPLHKASKTTKTRKKGSVWNSVHKVISRMIEENEKYRLRLNCQKLSNKNSN